MDWPKIPNNLNPKQLERLIVPLMLSGLGLLMGASLGPLLAASRFIPTAIAVPFLGLLGSVAGFIVGLRLERGLPSLSASSRRKVLAFALFCGAVPFLISCIHKPTAGAFLGGGVFILAALFILVPVRSLSFEIVVAGAVTIGSALAYLESGGLQWLVIAIIWGIAACAVLIRHNRRAA